MNPGDNKNRNEPAKAIAMPVVLFMLALMLRIYAALVPGVIVPDGIIYINTGKMINAGQWQGISDFGVYSLYPFIIVVFQKIFSDWEVAARIVSILFGSLAIVPLYFLVKRMFDMKIALAVSIFFIISPRLVEYSSNVIREPVFWFFSIMALWIAWEGIIRKKYVFMVGSSFFVGLATLTRMEGIVLPVIIFLWISWDYWKQRKSGIKMPLVLFLVFIISFPVIFYTPLYFLKNRIGRWELGQITSKIPRMLASGDVKATTETFAKIIEDSDDVSKILSGHKYLYFLWQVIYKLFRSYHIIFIFLFLIGITRRKIIPYNSREVPIVIWCFLFFLVLLLYVSKTNGLSTRHGTLISTPVFVWVSIGFFELSDILRNVAIRLNLKAEFIKKVPVALILLICIVTLPKTLSWSGYDKVELRMAGTYLKQLGLSKEKLAGEARLRRVAFYANSDFIEIPSTVDGKTLEEFLIRNKARVLIIDEKTVDQSIKRFITNDIGKINLKKIEVKRFRTFKEYSFAIFVLN